MGVQALDSGNFHEFMKKFSDPQTVVVMNVASFVTTLYQISKMLLNLSIPDVSLTRKKLRNIQTEKREAEY